MRALPVTRQLPPPVGPDGSRCPGRPHYPHRMPSAGHSAAPTRFAYLGPEGTFAEAALVRLTGAEGGPAVEARPQPSVAAALSAVRSGDCAAALVPLENSVEGSVPATMDGLVDGAPLVITREVFLEVAFVLGVRPGTRLGDVRTVASHPHALAQCRSRIAELVPDADVVPTASTADAARRVAEGEYDAAVSAPIAAERYRLDPLDTDVADHPGAVTRFVLVERPGPLPEPTGADKTTVTAVIADRTGALLDLLAEFAVRGISLTRIESRPTRERLGVYSFSIDCEGHVADARVGDALAALHRLCADLRFLGSYPRADAQPGKPVEERVGDAAFAGAAQWLASVREGTAG
jgi:prephenate dehydratase